MKGNHFVWKSFAGKLILSVILFLIILISYYSFGPSSGQSSAKVGQAIFDAECRSCHTIGGGDMVGPDLNGIFERRDRDWLVRFISTPDLVIAEGDPIALELVSNFNGIEMPNLALTAEEVEMILEYLEERGSLTAVTEALPEGSALNGEQLFTGAQPLEGGGIPCMGCHTVGGVGEYGGGNLGPDLTRVFDRYGESGLASAIGNISFPTMKYVYDGKDLTPQETADLLHFFEASNNAGSEGKADSATGLFWQIGSIGAFGLFAFMALFWSRQSKNQTERLRKKADVASRRQ